MYGDSVSVARWKDVWLNEGFATYAEWLWSEDQGLGTAQENFDFFYNDYVPRDDPFWSIVVADPGVEHLFDDPVYFRGAMTLHVLRLAVGDRTFFRILRGWARHKAGGKSLLASSLVVVDATHSIGGPIDQRDPRRHRMALPSNLG